MRAVCLQSLSSDRELQGKEVEVEEAISCLSRFEQTSERERGKVPPRLKCRVIKCRKRERDDWLSRVKVIDNIECVWPWLVT